MMIVRNKFQCAVFNWSDIWFWWSPSVSDVELTYWTLTSSWSTWNIPTHLLSVLRVRFVRISAHSLEAYGCRWNWVTPPTTAGYRGGSVDGSSVTRVRHSQRERVRYKEHKGIKWYQIKLKKILHPRFMMYLMASQPPTLTALSPLLSLSQEVHDNNLPKYPHVCCCCHGDKNFFSPLSLLSICGSTNRNFWLWTFL